MRIGISNLKRPYGAAVLAALCLAVGPRLRAADCNDNGVEDRVDLQEETSQDCDGNEIPDECDVAGTRLDLGACELISDTAIGFVLADLDGDSSTDVVLYGPGQPISVLWNDGRGGLVASSPILDHQIVGPLKAFDADGDGKADLTGFSQRGEQRALSVYRSVEGRRELTPAPHTLSLDFAPRDWSFEDLDSDGVPDLVVLDAFLAQVHLGHAEGNFSEAIPLFTTLDPLFVITADVDGDGRPDLITANGSDNVSVIINRGAGEFEVPRNYFAGGVPRSLGSVDSDRDGGSDLVVLNHGASVSVLKNDGAGEFSSIDVYPVADGACGIAIADADGNSFPDLLVLSCADFTRRLGTLLNRGDGSFQPVREHFLPPGPSSVGAADLDGDGRAELLLAIDEGAVALFKPRHVRADCNADGIPDACQLEGNDLDGNSIPDECDRILCWVKPFVRGDANADGLLDMSDAIASLVFQFVGGFELPCASSADVDDTGRVDISDPIHMLTWLYLSGTRPVYPFLTCGGDPTPDRLMCRTFPPCDG